MSRTLVVVSPRLGAVLPAAALTALRRAERVLADESVPAEVRAAADAEVVAGQRPAWPDGSCVLLSANADHPLMASADEVFRVREPEGAMLLDAVAVMDRLRSPGGCPWDAEQTHLSLLKYLIEECYELYQAVEDADRAALREELGDVLLQVLFHARLADEGPVAPFRAEGAAAGPFGIDEVAADLVRKLVDRHPHVFAVNGRNSPSDRVRTASDQEVRWEELKRAEKRRESSVDGVALGQPAAALAAKLVSRARGAGLPEELLLGSPSATGARTGASSLGAPVGPGNGPDPRLFHRVAELSWSGVDPEHELRRAALTFAQRVRAAETAARAAGLDPHRLRAEDWHRFWPR